MMYGLRRMIPFSLAAFMSCYTFVDSLKTDKVIMPDTRDSTLVDVIAEYDIHHQKIGPLGMGDSTNYLLLMGYTNMQDKKMLLNNLFPLDARRLTVLHEVNHIKDYNDNNKHDYTETQIDSLAFLDFKKIYNRLPKFEED